MLGNVETRRFPSLIGLRSDARSCRRRRSQQTHTSMSGTGRRSSSKGDTKKTGTRASRVSKNTSYAPAAKWTITDWKPPRKISDKELAEARKMFFDMDRDGSGSIDAEELGMMLRSLGQNPSKEELDELIASVDEGDKDGQIQLREFLTLYTNSLDSKTSGQAGREDVNNVFGALGVRTHRHRSETAHARHF